MSKYTKEQYQNFLSGVERGLDPHTAAWSARINPRDIIIEIAQGMDVLNGVLNETKTRTFSKQLALDFAQAKANAIARATMNVLRAEDWKASERWLQNNHSAQWGKFSGMSRSEFPELESGDV